VSAVDEAISAAGDGNDLLSNVDDVLRRMIGFDGATWFATDPATLLSTAPVRVSGIEAGHCDTFWQREFLVEDAILFRDLNRNSDPVGSLRTATDDRPVRSARFREFLAPQGYDDELRAVLKHGDNAWGLTAFYRSKGRPAFDANDRALLSAVAPVIADGLRRYVAGATPWQHTPMAPGLLLFGPGGALLSTNAEADAWLAEVDPGTALLSPAPVDRTWLAPAAGTPALQSGFPPALIPLVNRARAVAAGHEPGPARVRVRGRRGQWLVLHASCMSGDSSGVVAVVVEPAKSGEIAPIIVEAYQLSPREREVVRCVARGLTSAEIAAELYLSPHTVRDYVKSVFEKVGVSSRGELVAKLYADHYADAVHASYVHVA
jgi:DNA-binding CsgD family transcriptional regulator